MISFVEYYELEDFPGSMGYVALTNDSDIKKIESILNTPFKNIEAFKTANGTERDLAILLKTCTDLTVVDYRYWHPKTLFDSLSKISDLDIRLVNYSVTEDHIHYEIEYAVRGVHRILTIETDAIIELLNALNAELVDRQFIEVRSGEWWVLISNEVNIKDLAEAAYCGIRNS